MKKTLVIGASPNPNRYSYKAVNFLSHYGHEVIALGVKKGIIGTVEITTELPVVKDIDTVTMYLNPERQTVYYDYILKLNPRRIIFNPGTENDELIRLAKNNNIKTVQDCTLVMLNKGDF